MNGKNMNVRYRRGTYAKKRVKAIVAICAAAIILLAIIFIVIGLSLGRRGDDTREQPIGNDNTTVVDVPSSVPSVNGYAMSLSSVNSGTNTITAYVNRARGLGGNAISFAARDSSGKELYRSSLAQSMSKQSSSSGYVTLNDISNRTGSSMRTSAGVNVTAFGESDAIERSVLLAYDAAICAELCRGGVDDVFISLSGTRVSESNIEELLRFVDTVKSIESTATVGISLPEGFFETAGADTLVDRLADKYDFLLYDITGYDANTDGEAAEYATSSVDAAQFYIMMYNMRVLLPSTDDPAIAEMVEALKAKSITNWQVYIP